jgi:hypothetical protein
VSKSISNLDHVLKTGRVLNQPNTNAIVETGKKRPFSAESQKKKKNDFESIH